MTTPRTETWPSHPILAATLFRMVQFPPDGDTQPFWHETETTDDNVLLSGNLVLLLGDSEIQLAPGDTVVVRSGKHAWSNRTDALAVLATVAVSTAT